MPGTDRAIDPITKDYIDDDAGGWVTTRTIAPQIHHQLLSHAGAWAADPDSGCAAHLIPRKSIQATMLKFKDAYESALQPFVDDGAAEDLVVEIERDSRGRFSLEASLRDVQHGELELTNLLPFGAGEDA